MKSEQSKLRHDSGLEHEHVAAQQAAQTQAREFSSVEDLLRFDSEQHPVPPDVAARLSISVAAEPKPGKPWYKSLLGL